MEALRLIRCYRGYKAGSVIKATPQLAETLKREGTAVEDNKATFLEHQSAERAVASNPAIETR